ncbi:GRAS family transcription factor [Perilla frutescens var. hirtella]|nr:GRAS family transcription factor [Perilla frutescens var. hirtella]KAH6812167.1 GRAS family transcription factor [Perilla frutescens var. frutescens]
MKGMFSPFDFELVVKNNSSSFTDYLSGKNCFFSDNSFCEPISVLDSRIPCGPTSSSTLSSSLGGGGGGAASTDTAGVAAVSDRNPSPKWQQDSTTATSSSAGGVDSELIPVPPSLEVAASGGGGSAEKCAMEDWESVLSESAAASPGQEQSIFRWIMGDVEDPAVGTLNKFLQFGGGAAPTAAEFDFSGGVGVMDQEFAGENLGANFVSNLSNRSSSEKIDSAANHASSNPIKFHHNSQNLMFPSPVANNFGAISFHNQSAFDSSAETKPPIFNPQLLMNQHQAQNLSFFLPFPYAQEQEQSPAKRLNSGGQIPKGPFADAMFIGRQQLNHHQQQQQQLPPYLHHRPKMSGGDELQQQQQAIIDQLYKAAELLQAGNTALAQGILARLNHHLSPIGNPFHRAAFYCKEALQLLLHSTSTNSSSAADSSPLSLVFKIGAYKAFSEVSPLIEFANFTCNQALLEALEGFDRIHIVDFDIGYGGQWASLMQELALRGGGAPLLKITALVSHTTHDQLELTLTRENLIQFANEINVGFEFDIMSIDSLSSGSWSLPFHSNENEAVAVNIPVGCLTNYQLSAPLALRFVKQLSPRIVVSIDRGCDRTDLPFPNHIIHALQSYSGLLESLDAVNVNVDALQKIERFLLQPGMEKLVMSRFRAPEKSQHWRNMFLSCGFSPVPFSNFTESQAECVVKRTPVRGFQVEKRQSSLVLCWQRKELVSASVWRCSSL